MTDYLPECFAKSVQADRTLAADAVSIAGQLPAGGTLAAASQNAHILRAALAGASLAGANVLLPSSSAPAVLEYTDKHASHWLTDSALPVSKPYLSLQRESAGMPAVWHNITVTLMSSGSTGTPKTFPATLAQLITEAEQGFAPLCTENNALIRSTVSLQHRFGLSCHVLLPLLTGRPSQDMSCELPDMLLAVPASGEPPQWWVSSPAFLQRLAEHQNLPAWRGRIAGIFTAGGRLDSSVRSRIETALDTVITNIYGTSETGVMAYSQNAQDFRFIPAAGMEKSGDDVRVNLPWIDAPHTLEDRLRFGADGSFTIAGRKDAVIKIAEKRIDTAEMQHLLSQDTAIADSYIGLHPETGRLFTLAALSEAGITELRQHGRKALKARLCQHIAGAFPRIAVPRHWLFVDSLPRNSQSKLPKAEAERAILQPPRAPIWQEAENTPEKAVYHGTVPLDLLYLRGHFDDFGIVPGVIELQWAAALAAGWLGREISTAAMENLKFQKLLRPHDRCTVTLQKTAAGKLQFTLENGQGVCAAGRIVL